MGNKIKRYNSFIKENAVEVEPMVKPTTTPTPTRRKSPIRRDKPSVTPKPKASAEDVAKKFLELTKDNEYIQKLLSMKYSKGVKEGKENFDPQTLVKEIFDTIGDKFADRFFPLKVKITKREGQGYHVVVALGPGWTGRLSEEEEEGWLHPYCQSIQEEYDEVDFCGAMGDGHGGEIIYELSNDDFPSDTGAIYNMPEPLYPERLN